MRTVARRFRVLLVLALAGSSGLAAQVVVNNSQVPGDAIKGTGLLMGQVVDGTSGRPIAGATVALTGGPSATTILATGEIIPTPAANPASASTAPRQILTNSDGRFLFRELSRGRYTLRISATGYLAGGAGQTRPGGLMQAVELVSDDEKKGDLVARLWKSASLSGTILDESGEPVVGLSVRILRRTMTGGVPRFASTPLTSSSAGATDDRGMYRMSGLQPGEYLVGVMTSQVTLPVATSEAYYQMAASGVNTTNSDLYRELNSSGAPSPYTSGIRIGDLILQANSSGRGMGANSGPPVPTDERRIMTYQTQYYPASSTAAHATIITLGSGEDRGGIDMQLKLVPTVKVTGIVTGPDGPARNTGVKLVPLEAEAFMSELGAEAASTATDATGAFTMLGVTPGQYTLKILRVPRPAVSSSQMMMNTIEISSGNRSIISMSSIGPSTAPPPPLPPDPSLWANMPVTVGDSDLAGLAVSLKPGVRINGRIEFEGAKEKPTPEQIQRTSLGFTPIGGQTTSSQIALAAKRVEQNGRFSTVGYPPGRYLINASIPATATPGSPGNWTFRNATIGGRDVSNEGLDLTAEDIADLVITFTDQTTDLTGRVNDAKGVPDKDALVIVFPADTDSWKRGVMNARRMRSTRAATTGGFNFAALPPGAYYLAALPDATTSSEWQDPKILEALMGMATRIVLGEGEKKTQDLTTRTLR